MPRAGCPDRRFSEQDDAWRAAHQHQWLRAVERAKGLDEVDEHKGDCKHGQDQNRRRLDLRPVPADQRAAGHRSDSLYVNLDAKSYRDGMDITPDDIYAYVERTHEIPKTAAPLGAGLYRRLQPLG